MVAHQQAKEDLLKDLATHAVGAVLCLFLFTGLTGCLNSWKPPFVFLSGATSIQILASAAIGVASLVVSVMRARARLDEWNADGSLAPLVVLAYILSLAFIQLLRTDNSPVFRLNAAGIFVNIALGCLSASLLGPKRALNWFLVSQLCNAIVGIAAYPFAHLGIWSGGIFRTDAGLGSTTAAALLLTTALTMTLFANVQPPVAKRGLLTALGVGVVLCFTRDATLSLFGAATVWAVAARKGARSIPLLALCSALILAVWVGRTHSEAGIHSVASSDSWRRKAVSTGFMKFASQPFFGVGLGAYEAEIVAPAGTSGAPSIVTASTKFQFATWLCQLGVVGGCLVVGGLVATLRFRWAFVPTGAISASIFGAMTLWLFWGLADDPFLSSLSPYPDRLFAFVLVMAAMCPNEVAPSPVRLNLGTSRR